MKASILVKLETLVERYEEVQHLLGDPDVIGDQTNSVHYLKSTPQLEEVTKCFQAYQQAQDDLEAAEDMARRKTTKRCAKWRRKKLKKERSDWASNWWASDSSST